jgi:hypothetical protein
VLLKSKLNLLIPCGFLAILINYLSQNKVIFIHNTSSSSSSTTTTTTTTWVLVLFFFFFACGLLLILLLCFSEGLGISSEPVGYHSFGWAIGFRYRVICSHNFPLILGVIFLVKFDLLLLDAGS